MTICIKNKKGFTLIELLVVIAIIGILAVVAVPALFKNIGKAKIADLESEYSAIKSSVLVEYAENNKLDRGFGDLENLESNMENIDSISPIGGKYYIEVDGINEYGNNNLNFSGYRIDENGNYKYDKVVDDFKIGLLIRAEYWEDHDNNPSTLDKAINGPKITSNQFKKLAKDIGYNNVYVLKNEFPNEDQEIYIGIIPQ